MMMTRMVSILLSVFLLASHINLTIGTHYCRGQVVETKILFGETHMSCGMADLDELCDAPGVRDLNHINTPCCENHYQALPVYDDFLKDPPQVIVTVGLTAVLVYPILNRELFPKTAHQSYTDYSPPPLEKDIQVLFKTFII